MRGDPLGHHLADDGLGGWPDDKRLIQLLPSSGYVFLRGRLFGVVSVMRRG
jgi:hypothetical protein